MFHHNENGEVENGEVRFQLKAISKLKVSKDGSWLSQRVETRDLRYWYFELVPVVLIVYDAAADRAYWLHIQQYLDGNQFLMESDVCSITLRIPIRNKLSLRAIDRFRKLSLECVTKSRKDIENRT